MCGRPMVPLRLAQLDAWVERCPACEVLWVEKQDRRSLVLCTKQKARKVAYQSFSPKEREVMATELAQDVAPDAPSLSPFHALLAALGLPVVTRTLGAKTPWATWGLAAALVLSFLLSLAFGRDATVQALAYRAEEPTAWAALTAVFVHAGWLHLLGNVYFLLAFGDGVEQRVRRAALVVGFCLVGAASIVLQGSLGPSPALIYGASGGVEALVGACVVLQPRARVAVALLRQPAFVHLPIVVYGVFELMFQGAMAALGAPGVAWTGHLTGLLLGAALGGVVRAAGKPA